MTNAEILVYAVAALIGSLARSCITRHQAFLSRETYGDAFAGVLMGIIAPALWPALWPAVAGLLGIEQPIVMPLIVRAGVMAAVAYVAGDVVTNRASGLVRWVVGRIPAPPGNGAPPPTR